MAWINVAVVVLLFAVGTHQHGHLMNPVGRSSMWRVGFNTPVNFNDHELFCGGFWVSLKRLLFFEICMDNLGVDGKWHYN
jgi:hypothetical protein